MLLWQQLCLAGLWGGLMALERRAFLQAMFSRPLVAATCMGLLLDDVPSGVMVGLLLELFFLGGANLGASLPDNETLSATCTAAGAAMITHATGGSGSTPAIWSMAVLLFIGLGRVGRVLDRRLERHSAHLHDEAQGAAEGGNLRRAVRQNLWGMWPHFVLYGALTAACAGVGLLVAPYALALPYPVVRGLAWAFPAMASVAAAIAARGSRARRAGLFAGAAGAVVTLVSVLMLQGEP